MHAATEIAFGLFTEDDDGIIATPRWSVVERHFEKGNSPIVFYYEDRQTTHTRGTFTAKLYEGITLTAELYQALVYEWGIYRLTGILPDRYEDYCALMDPISLSVTGYQFVSRKELEAYAAAHLLKPSRCQVGDNFYIHYKNGGIVFYAVETDDCPYPSHFLKIQYSKTTTLLRARHTEFFLDFPESVEKIQLTPNKDGTVEATVYDELGDVIIAEFLTHKPWGTSITLVYALELISELLAEG